MTRSQLRIDPFLHIQEESIHSPNLDETMQRGTPGYLDLLALSEGRMSVDELDAESVRSLEAKGFLVSGSDEALSERFYLKYVSLEAHTVCNQACYFCPVSLAPRDAYFMPDDFYEDIVRQLSEYRETIDGVSMIQYNEPTVDKRFLDQVRLIKKYGLPPAVSTNGTGLTPGRADALVEMGGLRHLSVNFSTMDRRALQS